MSKRHNYVMTKRPGHPLAPPGGQLPLHRVLLYDAIGPGPHACHQCSTEVNWSSRRTAKGCLVVDHLDGDPTNNDLANLAPACHPCNTSRGHDARLEGELIMTSQKGTRAIAVERVCSICGKTFLIPRTNVEHTSDGTGSTCSRLCGNKSAARAQAAQQREATRDVEAVIKHLREQRTPYAEIASILDASGIRPLRSAKWSVASVYKIAQRE